MSSMQKSPINWQDDDSELGSNEFASTKNSSSGVSGESFEALLSQHEHSRSNSASDASVKIGKKIRAKILEIGSQSIFCDVGVRSEAFISKDQFSKEELEKLSVDDEIDLYCVSKSDEGIELAKTVKGADADRDGLLEAYRNKMPVVGKVDSENKGGYTVLLGKVKAFCPFSQMTLKSSVKLDSASLIGKSFEFQISQVRGRDVVLSRVALLREKEMEEKAKVLSDIEVGQIRAANIVKTEDFGVFVDVGSGVHALVPRSELSWSKVAGNNPKSYNIGDSVMVKILNIDRTSPKLRISASFKQCDDVNLWDVWTQKHENGSVVDGVVTKIDRFGVFVELAPGVEGLLHLSEMSAKRQIRFPGEVCKVSDRIKVKIIAIDSLKKRISLSIKQIELDENPELAEQFAKQNEKNNRHKQGKKAESDDEEFRGVEYVEKSSSHPSAQSSFAAAFRKAQKTKN